MIVGLAMLVVILFTTLSSTRKKYDELLKEHNYAEERFKIERLAVKKFSEQNHSLTNKLKEYKNNIRGLEGKIQRLLQKYK